jgi:ABC-type Fe2+-enterobactin transport system substrate-binding protein
MTKRIRVERSALMKQEPAIIVSEMDGADSGLHSTVRILGPSVVVQQSDPPKVWIETDADLEVA